MKSKAQQIQERLAIPIKVGDYVDMTVPYTKVTVIKSTSKKKPQETTQTESVYHGSGIVYDIVNTVEYGKLYAIDRGSSSVPSEIETKFGLLKNYPYQIELFQAAYVTQNTDDCGSNPFKENLPRITFYNNDISQLLMHAGYGKYNDDYTIPQYNKLSDGSTYGGINFDPYVIDENGERKYYQRGLVWTTEQKQLLIESIYNGIEIGKFLLRHKRFSALEQEAKETGHGFDYECVDGKQRYNALIEFVQGKFPDLHGMYFDDLSIKAKHKFWSYNNLSYGKMEENSTDKDVIEVFLTLNFTGVTMSREHLDYVKAIRVK